VSNSRTIWLAALGIAAYCPLLRAETAVKLENQLAACAEITLPPPSVEGNLVVSLAKVQLHKLTGECGCTSAFAHYSSMVNRGGATETLQEGLVGLKADGEKAFVLGSEPLLIKDAKIVVAIGCAAPL